MANHRIRACQASCSAEYHRLTRGVQYCTGIGQRDSAPLVATWVCPTGSQTRAVRLVRGELAVEFRRGEIARRLEINRRTVARLAASEVPPRCRRARGLIRWSRCYGGWWRSGRRSSAARASLPVLLDTGFHAAMAA